jgi:hypothetical protein
MRYGVAAAVLSMAMVAPGLAHAGSRSVEYALEKPVSVSWAGAAFTDCLADLAKQAGLGFLLDPALPAGARSAKVTYAGADVPAAVALGQALRAAGLRYLIRSGAVWISTPKRAAERVVYGDRRDVREAEPMGRGEAMEVLSPFEQEGYPLSDPRQIWNQPWTRVKDATVNPVTGLPDFPAPPIWIDAPDAGAARFSYSNRPYFMKPELLEKLDDDARLERELVNKLIAIIRSEAGQVPMVIDGLPGPVEEPAETE